MERCGTAREGYDLPFLAEREGSVACLYAYVKKEASAIDWDVGDRPSDRDMKCGLAREYQEISLESYRSF
jgi:hypothetical protein